MDQGLRCAEEGRHPGKAQFTGDDFGAEIALADKERHNELARGSGFGEDFFDVRLLFPKRLADAAEKVAAPQLGGMLKNWRSGLLV